MQTQKNIIKIFSILEKEVRKYDTPSINLIKSQTNSPFKILIATILSARTKDNLTIKVSQNLFKKVYSFNDIRKLSKKQMEKFIFPVGFYKTKAKHLKLLSDKMKTEFNDRIPNNLENLLKLPGVGRKTANLVLSLAFNKPAICVDTHVHKITNRIGIVKTNTPEETEMRLREVVPVVYWRDVNTILVPFGQEICRPISPFCSRCPINKFCKKINVEKNR